VAAIGVIEVVPCSKDLNRRRAALDERVEQNRRKSLLKKNVSRNTVTHLFNLS
jgi:hypothetical protein